MCSMETGHRDLLFVSIAKINIMAIEPPAITGPIPIESSLSISKRCRSHVLLRQLCAASTMHRCGITKVQWHWNRMGTLTYVLLSHLSCIWDPWELTCFGVWLGLLCSMAMCHLRHFPTRWQTGRRRDKEILLDPKSLYSRSRLL